MNLDWYQDFTQRMSRELVEHLSQDATALFMKGVPIQEFFRQINPQLLQMLGAMGGTPGFEMGISADAAYRILGLEKSATDEEVKKRYREMLHKLHPDTAGVQGTEFLLQIVIAAYEMVRRERGWHQCEAGSQY